MKLSAWLVFVCYDELLEGLYSSATEHKFSVI